jgi:Tfp pilus assembly protein PilF
MKHLNQRHALALFLLAGALPFASAQSPAAIQDHLQKAAAALRSKDPDSAAREFTAVLALDPKNAEANANLGVITFFRGDYKNASQYLRTALAADPSLAKTEALLGICEKKLGDPSAQALLEKSFPRVKEKSLQIQAGMELASIYYQQGSLDRAASTMRSLVDIDADNIEILYMAQRVYSELADDTLSKLALLAPGSARMQVVIAERLINEGDLKGATEHYRKALEMDPHLPGVHYELAEAILEAAPENAQAQADAKKELETAVRIEGDRAKTECMYARIALLRGDTNEAFARYQHAFALSPGDAEAQFGMGRMLATMDKPQEAAKYLRMAIQSDPLNDNAHFRLAGVCRKLGLNDEAEKETRLFKDIRDAKDRLEALYRQMHKKPPGQ